MAAPVLTATGLNDLVQTTLRELGRGRFTEIATDLQEHTAMSNLFRKNRIQLDSGYSVQWDVMVAQAGNARNVGLGATDNVNIADTMVQATADWRNTVTSYAIIGQEVSMNMTPSRIVDLVRTRRIQAMIDMAELMESNFWGPPVALTDNLTPWGVNTWIVKNSTQGFNGGVPSGYTTIGLNPTTYPRWSNWTDQYTSVSRDDLIRKLRRAATFIKFKPPVDGIPTFNTGDQYGWYTNYGVIGLAEEALESQNDNLGNDIASKDGQVLFRKVPLMWVPKLEADTTNPVYGLNWGWLKLFILKGWWLRETHIPVYPGQHTVSAHFMDCTYQIITRNRRCHAVIATGTTYPTKRWPMADPRIVTDITKRASKARLSALMQAKAETTDGSVVNFCPFGCSDDLLDDHGYCDHLVGFTNDSEAACRAGTGKMDPMVMNEYGVRVVQVPSRKEAMKGKKGGPTKKEIFEQPAVLPYDKLVRITTSYRVYRRLKEDEAEREFPESAAETEMVGAVKIKGAKQ